MVHFDHFASLAKREQSYVKHQIAHDIKEHFPFPPSYLLKCLFGMHWRCPSRRISKKFMKPTRHRYAHVCYGSKAGIYIFPSLPTRQSDVSEAEHESIPRYIAKVLYLVFVYRRRYVCLVECETWLLSSDPQFRLINLSQHSTIIITLPI